ncbi:MAG TPA: ATP-dependent zinc metalloprotease FtsH [Steroidobacteraceae bacterium]|nr:ATP-dependent zinc metalloprotease FtsH [Steroidobacteraceae bacterium]
MPSGSTDKRFYLFAACVIGALVLIAGVNLYQARTAGPHIQSLSYSEFFDDLDHGRVRSVTLTGPKIEGFLTDHRPFRSFAADDPALIPALRSKGVAITVQAAPAAALPWTSALATWVPMILLVGFAIFFMTRSGVGGRAMGLGKSQARPLTLAHDRVTFGDVAGVDEARDALQEMVQFLRDPQKFHRLGGRIPRGVLLVGPPGTGKTLLARAVAGEANVPFFTISGSHFVEMYVGVGASRVRDLFGQAKKHAPCIVFMDEIDAVGRRRGAGVGGGNDEREQTLNQLLVEMDGFESNADVILMAATNRPDVLDPALLRPGRFDRQIAVANPDVLGREQILCVHARRIPLAPGTDLGLVARGTPGFSGADLMNLVNEAALLAARRGHDTVGWREFEDAKDTVTMGAERRTHVMGLEEKRLTAYREGGRAIIALHLPAADPVHKVTILTRGRTTGMVKQLPEGDQAWTTLEQMNSQLAVLLGGRVAEELTFGRNKVTSGTAGDIEEATKLARLMVTRWGLSEALGTVAYGENQDEVFLGHSIARQQNISEHTAQIIAVEVRKLIDAALEQGRAILSAHRAQLDTLARGLVQFETLTGDEIRGLLEGKAPARVTAAEYTTVTLN